MIGIGLGLGVLAYSSHPDEPPPPRPAPAVVITSPPPDPPPVMIELHFDSLPSGGVYADGRSAELCSTPCAFDVDLKDGGSTEHRTFVVRSPRAIRDKSVTVELAGTERAFHLTLEREEAAVPTSLHTKRPRPGGRWQAPSEAADGSDEAGRSVGDGSPDAVALSV